MSGLFDKLVNSKLSWLIYRQIRKVWFRVVGFAIFALGTVALAQALGHLVPSGLGRRLGADAVDQVLTILASSMLAVTTFSLSISVSAFSSAAQSATPRATALLQEDNTTQNVLATFLGGFLFSLVGIVALKAGYYSQEGRLVLFAATVVTIALIVVALIRWISHLTTFGLMGDTLDRVERAASKAVERRLAAPWLGGRPQRGDPPKDAVPVCAAAVSYIQHIDMNGLCETARKRGVNIWILALPGNFVHPAAPLMLVDCTDLDQDVEDELRECFTCAAERDFIQDPTFGLTVLSEIASRALSPAVNDPGTAVDVIGRLSRVLALWRSNPDAKLDYPEIFVPSLTVDDLLEAAFAPIARDGAAIFEVQLRLQEVLRALSKIGSQSFAAPAMKWSAIALEHANASTMSDREVAILHETALAGSAE